MAHSDELLVLRELKSMSNVYRKFSTLTGEDVDKGSVGLRFGQENISGAWSADNSLFAWSVGTSTLAIYSAAKLLPTHYANLDKDSRTKFPGLYSNESKNNGQEMESGKLMELDCGGAITHLAFGCRSDLVDKAGTRRGSQVNYSRFTTKGDIVLAVGLANGDIKIYDMEDPGRMALYLQDHTDAITTLRFSPDGSMLLASASKDRTVKLWDLPDDGNMMATLTMPGPSDTVTSVSWSPDGQHLAVVGSNKDVLIYDVEKRKVEKKLSGHQNELTACRYSHDGQFLYTSSFDTRVICWNAETGEIVHKFEHMSPPPSKIFASGTNEHEVLAMDIRQNHLVTLCHDGLLRIWMVDSKNLKDSAARAELVEDATTIVLSADGRVVVVGCKGGFLQFCSVE